MRFSKLHNGISSLKRQNRSRIIEEQLFDLFSTMKSGVFFRKNEHFPTTLGAFAECQLFTHQVLVAQKFIAGVKEMFSSCGKMNNFMSSSREFKCLRRHVLYQVKSWKDLCKTKERWEFAVLTSDRLANFWISVSFFAQVWREYSENKL